MSYSGSTVGDPDEFDGVPPLDRLTVFDFLENLALPQRMEKLQETTKHKVRRLQERTKSSSKLARDLMVDEWRKRVPTSEEKLEQYRKRMRESVDRLNRRWTGSRAVTTREKVSFITSVLNIFLSGYLIGAFPQYFHYWYTVQIMYFMPIRYYTYQKRGYHYFLADLCYFVNLLLLLSIWVFPHSKRLFISTFCLAFGNNAVAIAMWRNSLVFHSLDKITRLLYPTYIADEYLANTVSASSFISCLASHFTLLSISSPPKCVSLASQQFGTFKHPCRALLTTTGYLQ